ncbi:hypothetical protein [Parasphingorhabdus sp.]|uniref:hypothetical protein n=1 Tax=Parasphingorhabdus sp. TaxID=2709688 RepID=UPI0030028928
MGESINAIQHWENDCMGKIEELGKAKLPRQGWGWRYGFGLRELDRAYQSSRYKSDAELADIHERASRHQRLVDEGKAVWTEEDEEGYPVYDYGEHLGEQAFDEERVLNLVRGAFAISLHHYIETKIGPQLPKRNMNMSLRWNGLRLLAGNPMKSH